MKLFADLQILLNFDTVVQAKPLQHPRRLTTHRKVARGKSPAPFLQQIVPFHTFQS